MRSLLVACVLVMPVAASADGIDPAVVQLWDVIHTADGSVLKGVIVEEVPGTSLRISLPGGSSLVVQMTNVVRITRELNPALAGTAPRAAGGLTAPAITAGSGLRIGIVPGIAFHSDLDVSTLLATGYVGYELGLDRWGVIPNVSLLYAADTGEYEEDSFGAGAAVRAAYRGSTVSPFVGFGLGVDIISAEPSLSTHAVAGIELVVHRSVALTIEGRLHRGFGGEYTIVHEFAAVGMGVVIRR